jgi:hypothetical protein
MATSQVYSPSFDVLPRLPKPVDLNEKTGIMCLIKNIFKKQKEIAPIIVDVINQELLHKISCEKLRRSNSLLDRTLIINSMRNYLKKDPVAKKRVKKSQPPLKTKMPNDDDIPLGMLKL